MGKGLASLQVRNPLCFLEVFLSEKCHQMMRFWSFQQRAKLSRFTKYVFPTSKALQNYSRDFGMFGYLNLRGDKVHSSKCEESESSWTKKTFYTLSTEYQLSSRYSEYQLFFKANFITYLTANCSLLFFCKSSKYKGGGYSSVVGCVLSML